MMSVRKLFRRSGGRSVGGPEKTDAQERGTGAVLVEGAVDVSRDTETDTGVVTGGPTAGVDYGPWDSACVGDRDVSAPVTPRRHRHTDHKRVRLVPCEFDIPAEYAANVAAGLNEDGEPESMHFFGPADGPAGSPGVRQVTVSLRVVTSPRTGDWWAESMQATTVADVTGLMAGQGSVETGTCVYGDTVDVRLPGGPGDGDPGGAEGVLIQRIVGFSGVDSAAWTVVATVSCVTGVTDRDLGAVEDMLSTMVVYRGHGLVGPPGTPMTLCALEDNAPAGI